MDKRVKNFETSIRRMSKKEMKRMEKLTVNKGFSKYNIEHNMMPHRRAEFEALGLIPRKEDHGKEGI